MNIEAKLCHLLGKKVRLSDNAEICLQLLAESERNFYSWHLKLLSIIFDLIPETLKYLKEKFPCFEKFDFEFLDLQVQTYFKKSSHVCHDTIQYFDDFLVTLFVKPPDTGAIAVLSLTSTSPKTGLINDYVTVDHLIALLFDTLYAGEYESDLAIAILIMSDRGLIFYRVNRWYLDSMEGIMTKTEVETQKSENS